MTQVVVEPSLIITLVQHIPWFAWLAMAGVFFACLSGIVKMIIIHRERMAMIRCGMDPDSPNRKPIYQDLDA